MSGDWSFWLREHRSTLLAFAGFFVMFTIYAANHPAGLNAKRRDDRCQQGVLLAIVAMAQTLVVLTSGIDLSVGMVMVLANCLASSIVVGSPVTVALGVVGVLLVGCLCGAINGLIVIYGRLQPIVHHHCHRLDLLWRGVCPEARSRRRRRQHAGRCADRPVARRRAGESLAVAGAGAGGVAALSPLDDRPRGVCDRIVRGRGLHVGRADTARQVRRVHAVWACSRRWPVSF